MSYPAGFGPYGSGSTAGYDGGPSRKQSEMMAKGPSSSGSEPSSTPGPEWDKLALALQDRDAYIAMAPDAKSKMLAQFGEEAFALQAKNKHERRRRRMPEQRDGSTDSRHEPPADRASRRTANYIADIPADSPLWRPGARKEVNWAAMMEVVQKDENLNTRQRMDRARHDARTAEETATAQISDMLGRQAEIAGTDVTGHAFSAAGKQISSVVKEREKHTGKVKDLTTKMGKLAMTRKEQKKANTEQRKEWHKLVKRDEEAAAAAAAANMNTGVQGMALAYGGGGSYGGNMSMPMSMLPAQQQYQMPQQPFLLDTTQFSMDPSPIQNALVPAPVPAPPKIEATFELSKGKAIRRGQIAPNVMTEVNGIEVLMTPSIPKRKAKSSTPPSPKRSRTPRPDGNGGNKRGGGGGRGGVTSHTR